MDKMNLFDDKAVNIDYFDELYKSLKNNELGLFEYKDWLLDILNDVLEYDSNDITRPVREIELLYSKFKDIFTYNGKAYHGFKTMNSLEDMLGCYKGLVSWSTDINIAYLFGNDEDIDIVITTTSMIISYNLNGFDFCSFLSVILNVFREDKRFKFIEKYLLEKEVLGYLNLTDIDILDLKDFTLEGLIKRYQ